MPPSASWVMKNSRLWKRHDGLSAGFFGVAVWGCVCVYEKARSEKMRRVLCSLVPRPTAFFLFFGLRLIHGCGRAVKNGEGLVSFIT